MAIPDNQLPADVLEALGRGDTISAIKLLRASSGLGLKEAKDAIDAHRDGRPVSATASPPAAALSPQVVAAMHGGNKIEAIKLLREETGLGLKEAKDAIEAAEAKAGASAGGGPAPGAVGGSGNAAWWIVALVVAAIGAYLLFARAH